MTSFIKQQNNPSFFEQVSQQLTAAPSEFVAMEFTRSKGFSFSKVKKLDVDQFIAFEKGAKELLQCALKKTSPKAKTNAKELAAMFATCHKVARICATLLEKQSRHLFKRSNQQLPFSCKDFEKMKESFDYTTKEKIYIKAAQLFRINLDSVDKIKLYCSDNLLEAAIDSNEKLALQLIDNGVPLNALDEDGGTYLMGACLFSKREVIAKLIERGVDIDAVDAKGNTALMHACDDEDLEDIALLLLDKKANVNIANKKGETALINACLNDMPTVVGKLIELGANVNAADENGNTALLWACRKSSDEPALLLLDKKVGTNIDIANKKGETALIVACMKSLPEVVSKLIESGADATIADEKGDTALIWAACKGLVDVVVQLIDEKKVDCSIVNKDNESALLSAVQTGCLETEETCLEYCAKIILKLIQSGAPLDICDKNGTSAFLKILDSKYSIERKEEIALAMIKRGVTVTGQTKDGDTALILACRHGLKAVAKLLLSTANVHAKNERGENALYWACRANLEEEALELIKMGSDLNVTDSEGKSIFYWACLNDLEAAACELIRLGVNVKTVASIGATPLHVCGPRLRDVAYTLIDMGVDINAIGFGGDTALFQAIRNQDSNLALFLISKGADIHKEIILRFIEAKGAVRLQGTTVFLEACVHGLTELAFVLMEKGVDIHKVDKQGHTALMCALIGRSKEIAFKLIETGVDVHAVSTDGTTAFSCACRVGLEEVINVLLQKNVNVHFVDKEGNTAFHYACQYALLGLARFLRTQLDSIDVIAENKQGRTPFDELWRGGDGPMQLSDLERMGAFSKEWIPHFLDHTEPKKGLAAAIECNFLVQNINNARTNAAKLTKKEFDLAVDAIKKKYKKSNFEPFITNLKYKVTETHFTALPDAPIPKKPDGVAVRTIMDIFEKVNFYDAAKADFIAAPLDGDDSDSDDEEKDTKTKLKNSLETFIGHVERKTVYEGTPKKEPALTQFYDVITAATCHIIQKLQSTGNAMLCAETIKEFILASDNCGPRIYNNAVTQFQKLIHNVLPTYKNELLKVLNEHRKVLLSSLVPEGAHNVHYDNKLVKALGVELGIPGSRDIVALEDPFLGEPLDKEEAKKKFFELYTPCAIVKEVIEPLFRSEEIRSKFIEWLREDDGKNIPKDFKQDDEEEDKGYAYLMSISDPASPMRFAKEAVIKSLVALQILEPAFQFAAE